MKQVYIFFILILVILSAAAAWSIPLETTGEVLPVILKVTNATKPQLGFSIAGDELKELDFGSTFPGTTVIKTVNITRGNQPPAFVSLSAQGTIAPWVELSNEDFLLTKLTQVKVSVRVPEDAPEGTYTGNITVLYKKTVFSLFLP
jgi:hypothetical protein